MNLVDFRKQSFINRDKYELYINTLYIKDPLKNGVSKRSYYFKIYLNVKLENNTRNRFKIYTSGKVISDILGINYNTFIYILNKYNGDVKRPRNNRHLFVSEEDALECIEEIYSYAITIRGDENNI